MQEVMNIQNNTHDLERPQPSVQQDLEEQLIQLRDELSRTAHELRMKSKGSSAEVHDTLKMLDREAKRFRAEVEEAVERTQRDLIDFGEVLQMRLQKLANQIAMPPS